MLDCREGSTKISADDTKQVSKSPHLSPMKAGKENASGTLLSRDMKSTTPICSGTQKLLSPSTAPRCSKQTCSPVAVLQPRNIHMLVREQANKPLSLATQLQGSAQADDHQQPGPESVGTLLSKSSMPDPRPIAPSPASASTAGFGSEFGGHSCRSSPAIGFNSAQGLGHGGAFGFGSPASVAAAHTPGATPLGPAVRANPGHGPGATPASPRLIKASPVPDNLSCSTTTHQHSTPEGSQGQAAPARAPSASPLGAAFHSSTPYQQSPLAPPLHTLRDAGSQPPSSAPSPCPAELATPSPNPPSWPAPEVLVRACIPGQVSPAVALTSPVQSSTPAGGIIAFKCSSPGSASTPDLVANVHLATCMVTLGHTTGRSDASPDLTWMTTPHAGQAARPSPLPPPLQHLEACWTPTPTPPLASGSTPAAPPTGTPAPEPGSWATELPGQGCGTAEQPISQCRPQGGGWARATASSALKTTSLKTIPCRTTAAGTPGRVTTAGTPRRAAAATPSRAAATTPSRAAATTPSRAAAATPSRAAATTPSRPAAAATPSRATATTPSRAAATTPSRAAAAATPSRATATTPSRATATTPSRATATTPSRPAAAATPSRATAATPSRAAAAATPSRATAATPSRATATTPSRAAATTPSRAAAATPSRPAAATGTPSNAELLQEFSHVTMPTLHDTSAIWTEPQPAEAVFEVSQPPAVPQLPSEDQQLVTEPTPVMQQPELQQPAADPPAEPQTLLDRKLPASLLPSPCASPAAPSLLPPAAPSLLPPAAPSLLPPAHPSLLPPAAPSLLPPAAPSLCAPPESSAPVQGSDSPLAAHQQSDQSHTPSPPLHPAPADQPLSSEPAILPTSPVSLAHPCSPAVAAIPCSTPTASATQPKASAPDATPPPAATTTTAAQPEDAAAGTCSSPFSHISQVVLMPRSRTPKRLTAATQPSSAASPPPLPLGSPFSPALNPSPSPYTPPPAAPPLTTDTSAAGTATPPPTPPPTSQPPQGSSPALLPTAPTGGRQLRSPAPALPSPLPPCSHLGAAPHSPPAGQQTCLDQACKLQGAPGPVDPALPAATTQLSPFPAPCNRPPTPSQAPMLDSVPSPGPHASFAQPDEPLVTVCAQPTTSPICPAPPNLFSPASTAPSNVQSVQQQLPPTSPVEPGAGAGAESLKLNVVEDSESGTAGAGSLSLSAPTALPAGSTLAAAAGPGMLPEHLQPCQPCQVVPQHHDSLAACGSTTTLAGTEVDKVPIPLPSPPAANSSQSADAAQMQLLTGSQLVTPSNVPLTPSSPAQQCRPDTMAAAAYVAAPSSFTLAAPTPELTSPGTAAVAAVEADVATHSLATTVAAWEVTATPGQAVAAAQPSRAAAAATLKRAASAAKPSRAAAAATPSRAAARAAAATPSRVYSRATPDRAPVSTPSATAATTPSPAAAVGAAGACQDQPAAAAPSSPCCPALTAMAEVQPNHPLAADTVVVSMAAPDVTPASEATTTGEAGDEAPVMPDGSIHEIAEPYPCQDSTAQQPGHEQPQLQQTGPQEQPQLDQAGQGQQGQEQPPTPTAQEPDTCPATGEEAVPGCSTRDVQPAVTLPLPMLATEPVPHPSPSIPLPGATKALQPSPTPNQDSAKACPSAPSPALRHDRLSLAHPCAAALQPATHPCADEGAAGTPAAPDDLPGIPSPQPAHQAEPQQHENLTHSGWPQDDQPAGAGPGASAPRKVAAKKPSKAAKRGRGLPASLKPPPTSSAVAAATSTELPVLQQEEVGLTQLGTAQEVLQGAYTAVAEGRVRQSSEIMQNADEPVEREAVAAQPAAMAEASAAPSDTAHAQPSKRRRKAVVVKTAQNELPVDEEPVVLVHPGSGPRQQGKQSSSGKLATAKVPEDEVSVAMPVAPSGPATGDELAKQQDRLVTAKAVKRLARAAKAAAASAIDAPTAATAEEELAVSEPAALEVASVASKKLRKPVQRLQQQLGSDPAAAQAAETAPAQAATAAAVPQPLAAAAAVPALPTALLPKAGTGSAPQPSRTRTKPAGTPSAAEDLATAPSALPETEQVQEAGQGRRSRAGPMEQGAAKLTRPKRGRQPSCDPAAPEATRDVRAALAPPLTAPIAVAKRKAAAAATDRAATLVAAVSQAAETPPCAASGPAPRPTRSKARGRAVADSPPRQQPLHQEQQQPPQLQQPQPGPGAPVQPRPSAAVEPQEEAEQVTAAGIARGSRRGKQPAASKQTGTPPLPDAHDTLEDPKIASGQAGSEAAAGSRPMGPTRKGRRGTAPLQPDRVSAASMPIATTTTDSAEPGSLTNAPSPQVQPDTWLLAGPLALAGSAATRRSKQASSKLASQQVAATAVAQVARPVAADSTSLPVALAEVRVADVLVPVPLGALGRKLRAVQASLVAQAAEAPSRKLARKAGFAKATLEREEPATGSPAAHHALGTRRCGKAKAEQQEPTLPASHSQPPRGDGAAAKARRSQPGAGASRQEPPCAAQLAAEGSRRRGPVAVDEPAEPSVVRASRRRRC